MAQLMMVERRRWKMGTSVRFWTHVNAAMRQQIVVWVLGDLASGSCFAYDKNS